MRLSVVACRKHSGVTLPQVLSTHTHIYMTIILGPRREGGDSWIVQGFGVTKKLYNRNYAAIAFSHTCRKCNIAKP